MIDDDDETSNIIIFDAVELKDLALIYNVLIGHKLHTRSKIGSRFRVLKMEQRLY